MIRIKSQYLNLLRIGSRKVFLSALMIVALSSTSGHALAGDIQIRVYKVLSETLNVNIVNISPDHSLVDELGVDWFGLVELEAALEEEFNIEISSEEMENMEDVLQVVQYVNSVTVN